MYVFVSSFRGEIGKASKLACLSWIHLNKSRKAMVNPCLACFSRSFYLKIQGFVLFTSLVGKWVYGEVGVGVE